MTETVLKLEHVTKKIGQKKILSTISALTYIKEKYLVYSAQTVLVKQLLSALSLA